MDPNETVPSSGARRRLSNPRPKSRIPFTVRYLLPVGLLAILAIWLLPLLRDEVVSLQLVDRDGFAVQSARLTFYPRERSSAALAPPDPLGTLTVKDGGAVVAGENLVPDQALVKVEADGFGIRTFVIELGQETARLTLGPAGSVTGRVQGVDRSPVAGARVLGIGGGGRGVPIAETESAADGSFTLSGYDAEMDSLVLRVLTPGYEIVDRSWWTKDWKLRDNPQPPVLEVRPTQLISGRLMLSDGLSAAGLRVVARSVPGISATVAEDGVFALDHVPGDLAPRLVVHGLPADYTHRQTRAEPGQEDVIIGIFRATTISGFVLDRATGKPLDGADVFHQHGPGGLTHSRAASDGSFTIDRVPPGKLRLSAQVQIPSARPPAPTARAGVRELLIEEGEPLQNIIIRVE